MIVYIMKVAHVQSGCVMPELSDTLLALTGISGVTFLTMRASENKPAVENAPEDAAAVNVVAPAGSPVDVVSTTTVSVSNNPVTGP
jgi:hypothetical protein